MRLHPARRDCAANRLADFEHDARSVDRPARVMEQHGKPQREQLRAHVNVYEHRRDLREPAATTQHEQGECVLLLRRESRHVGVLDDVRTVLVKSEVRNR